MILTMCILIVSLSITVNYIVHGIYIKSIEFKAGIKGFNFKIETKEKSTPSRKR